MGRKRPTHSTEFKAKAALPAILAILPMAELVKKFDVHANRKLPLQVDISKVEFSSFRVA